VLLILLEQVQVLEQMSRLALELGLGSALEQGLVQKLGDMRSKFASTLPS